MVKRDHHLLNKPPFKIHSAALVERQDGGIEFVLLSRYSQFEIFCYLS